jgi:uncharacterized membrane protein YkoI
MSDNAIEVRWTKPGLTRPAARRIAGATVTACLAALALSVGALNAFARPMPAEAFAVAFEDEESPAARTVQRGPVSLQEATALATRRHAGRVVRAETVSAGGRRVHVIRILGDDNRVRTVRVDAETGGFL